MTEHEQRIEQLMTEMPKIERTFAEKIERAIAWIAAVVAAAALTVAVVDADRSAEIASCTHTSIGAVDLLFARQLRDLQVLTSTKTSQLQKDGAVSDYLHAFTTYAHSIGSC